eukprot:260264_1
MLAIFLFTVLCVVKSTETPLIGVLTLPCSVETYQCVSNPNATSYLGSSYVKWLEGGGARVIPLIADDSYQTIAQLIPQLNGILITGGAAYDNSSSFWWNQLNNILDTVRKFRDESHYTQAIPLWATCLGFEGIQQVIAGTTSIKQQRVVMDESLSINFTQSAAISRIFNSFMDKEYSQMVYRTLSASHVAYHHHKYGISPNAYNGSHEWLSSNLSVLGTNTDEYGNTFVSLIESLEETKLYWYGSQFHPEKPQYVFDAHHNDNHIAHDMNAIIVSQYLVEFFVNECRMRNTNTMNQSEYDRNVIYNYHPYFVDNGTVTYEQVYLFENPTLN